MYSIAGSHEQAAHRRLFR